MMLLPRWCKVRWCRVSFTPSPVVGKLHRKCATQIFLGSLLTSATSAPSTPPTFLHSRCQIRIHAWPGTPETLVSTECPISITNFKAGWPLTILPVCNEWLACTVRMSEIKAAGASHYVDTFLWHCWFKIHYHRGRTSLAVMCDL